MLTALIIVLFLIFVVLMLIFFTGKDKDDDFPNANKRTEKKKVNNNSVAEKNSERLFEKFRNKKYITGNFLNMDGLPPEIYGMQLLKRRGYSHKRTNK